MTILELIERLKLMPPGADVCTLGNQLDWRDIESVYISSLDDDPITVVVID